MKKTMLQTRGLTKQYGEFTALDSVSLALNEGDIYGLIGRNGAGKTTFFKCVMGLARPTAGEIAIGGQANLHAARRRIGFMIGLSFYPYLNPKENLEYLCRVKGTRGKGEADRLLKLVGLDGVKKPFKAFSMGMKQRLGIAGALLGSPPIVVLDEPINGLDPQGIIDMRTLILDTHRQSCATFIISSHILSELDLVATRFGFIDHGVLVKEITHDDLHEHTKKSLVVEVDDIAKARLVLQAELGIKDAVIDGNQMTLNTHLDEPNKIAHALVSNGVELMELRRRETTLEEYFVKLVGGGQDA